MRLPSVPAAFVEVFQQITCKPQMPDRSLPPQQRPSHFEHFSSLPLANNRRSVFLSNATTMATAGHASSTATTPPELPSFPLPLPLLSPPPAPPPPPPLRLQSSLPPISFLDVDDVLLLMEHCASIPFERIPLHEFQRIQMFRYSFQLPIHKNHLLQKLKKNVATSCFSSIFDRSVVYDGSLQKIEEVELVMEAVDGIGSQTCIKFELVGTQPNGCGPTSISCESSPIEYVMGQRKALSDKDVELLITMYCM
ncbi:unnamed protein product [Litomosoides sigmodontis]|uniref:Uncharacterized protein n=1 Tax=Litomosoides sigmodontis TaxID=42156 RepID=A0A3P6SK68_LITSI|nr:unnamed protein product [Litomosoides sigmodontis]